MSLGFMARGNGMKRKEKECRYCKHVNLSGMG
jgi:hypothetical protein